jgi:hypothetical protein
MSDYITNLVARTLNFAPVVQPRLASLFESGSRAGAMGRALSEDQTHGNEPTLEPKSRAPATVFSNPQASPVRPQVREQMEVNLLDREKSDGEQDSGKQKDSGAVVVHRLSALPRTVEPGHESIAVRSALPEPEIVRSHRLVRDQIEAPETAASESDQSSITREREENWPLLQPRIRQLVDDRLTRLQLPGPDAAERAKPAQSGPVAIAKSSKSAAPSEVAAMRPNPHFIREPVATETEPTINVTIGRIDVRAIISQPSSVSRPARIPQPTTSSLDEYLKKRSEGRR